MNGSNKGDLKVFRYPDLFYEKRQENFTILWIWKSYYYIIIIIIFGEKFDYPVNSIIRTGAGPVESGLPSFYCSA